MASLFPIKLQYRSIEPAPLPGTLENETAVGTPVAARLEDPSRSLLRSALSSEAAGALGTAQPRVLAGERGNGNDVSGVGERGRRRGHRDDGGLVAGEHARVELPGGEGVGRGGDGDERGRGAFAAAPWKRRRWVRQEELAQGFGPLRERTGAAGGVDEDRAIL